MSELDIDIGIHIGDENPASDPQCCIRNVKPDANKPMLVSIGPYHRSDSGLEKMQENKESYLQLLLDRIHLTREMLLSELANLEVEARLCYVENSIKISDFLEMMLLDSCFIVEFLRKMDNGGAVHFDKNAAIDKVQSNVNQIRCDMIVLGNQLPFFVLLKFYDVTKSPGEKPLEEMAMSFFNFMLPRPCLNFNHVLGNNTRKIKHLLHLVHILGYLFPKKHIERSTSTCIPFLAERKITKNRGIGEGSDDQTRCPLLPQSSNKGNDKSYEMNDHIGTVVELQEVGIQLQKVGKVYTGELKKETENDYVGLFDIDYKCWVMKVPCFKVDDSTEILLRNLIAYEQHFQNVDHKHFTDFAILMSQLIDTEQDAKVLRSKKIIMSFLGNDKDLSNLFNRLAEGVSQSYQPYYLGVLQKVHRHCTSTCNILMAKLIHGYRNNPWVGFSTAAAVVLLILRIYSYI